MDEPDAALLRSELRDRVPCPPPRLVENAVPGVFSTDGQTVTICLVEPGGEGIAASPTGARPEQEN